MPAVAPPPVAIVNRDLKVTGWNPRAEDLWGLRSDEVLGKSLLGLDIGLPVARIEERIMECLNGRLDEEDVVMKATNRRGKQIDCRVSCMPLQGLDGKPTGAIIVMEGSGPRT